MQIEILMINRKNALMVHQPTGTFLFTDIQGSTQLNT